MDKNILWVEVKVSYLFPDAQAVAPILMRSYNRKTGKQEFLLDDGTFAYGTPTENQSKRIVRIPLTMTEKWDNPKMLGETRKYTKVRYVPIEHEDEVFGDDKLAKINNNLQMKIVSFLYTHENVVVKDERGNNVNENTKASPLYELVDESFKIRKENERNKLIAKYKGLFTVMLEENPAKMVEFCYAVEVPNIKGTPIEVLYNKLCHIIDNRPQYVDVLYNSSKLAFRAMVNRAIYEQDDTKKTVIELDKPSGYYMFNNAAIGKTIEEVYGYFETNPNALKALEQKMGRYTEQNVVSIGEQRKVKELSPKAKMASKKVVFRDSAVIVKIKQTLVTEIQNIGKKKDLGKDYDFDKFIELVAKLEKEFCYGDDDSLNKKYAREISNQIYNLMEAFGFAEKFEEVRAKTEPILRPALDGVNKKELVEEKEVVDGQ